MEKNMHRMWQHKKQEGFALPIAIGVIAVLVIIIGGGYFYIQNQSKEAAKLQEQQKVIMEEEAMEKAANSKAESNGEVMEKKEDATAMKKENGQMAAAYKGTVLAGTSSPLLDFTKADYDVAVASDKLVVLYFYANWCPICTAEFPQAQAAFNQLTSSNVVGFRVNYKDNQTDADEQNLARQFGVPYQHTKVFIKNGKQILKAPDSWDKARYLAEINKIITQ